MANVTNPYGRELNQWMSSETGEYGYYAPDGTKLNAFYEVWTPQNTNIVPNWAEISQRNSDPIAEYYANQTVQGGEVPNGTIEIKPGWLFDPKTGELWPKDPGITGYIPPADLIEAVNQQNKLNQVYLENTPKVNAAIEYANNYNKNGIAEADQSPAGIAGGSVVSGDVGSLQEMVVKLQNTVNQLMATGGGYRPPQRLFMAHKDAGAMVQETLRSGLNEGEFDTNSVMEGSQKVLEWIISRTGLSPAEVRGYLSQILGAGASALTMIVSGGNFPLGAMAYFGGQAATKILLGEKSSNPNTPTKKLFEGYQGVGYIDGQEIQSLDLALPSGLPNDIFGGYRYICCDKLAYPPKWIPSDQISVINYWSDEPYRYVCLDRVTSKIYHANSIYQPKIYI
jgi:hypothetical protein